MGNQQGRDDLSQVTPGDSMDVDGSGDFGQNHSASLSSLDMSRTSADDDYRSAQSNSRRDNIPFDSHFYGPSDINKEDSAELETPCLTDAEIEEEFEKLCEKETVPMVFHWGGGGRKVYVSGTFNKWQEKIPMHRSGNDFTLVHDLKKGKYAYKFIVDDEWRFASSQETLPDQKGGINNIADLSNFSTQFDDLETPMFSPEEELNESVFFQDMEQYPWTSKQPPQLPPHLRTIILNENSESDGTGTEKVGHASSLPRPMPVTLNHLYCSAIKDNVMVLGTTQRYREKFVTTVVYSPLTEDDV